MTEGFPAGGRARRSTTPSCAATSHVATQTIRDKRAAAVAELPDWEELREAGGRSRIGALRHLDVHLRDARAERSAPRAATCTGRATQPEANRDRRRDSCAAAGAREVVKVKSMATEEIGLNDALALRGITALETDLAELIVQLAGDRPSHILVPAIHRNRAEIRSSSARELPGHRRASPTSRRRSPRRRGATCAERFLPPASAVSGANFAVAETGTRLRRRVRGQRPDVHDAARGADHRDGDREGAAPTVADLEVMLQLLPRSSTGERMNPYTSLWTGVTDGDGPRSSTSSCSTTAARNVLADAVGRQALHCIRCSACLNSARSMSGSVGTPTAPPTRGRSARSSTPQLAGLKDGTLAAMGLLAVRRLLRGLPGQDRHPTGPHPPARADRRRAHPADAASASRCGRSLGVFSSRRRYEAAQRAMRLGRGRCATRSAAAGTAVGVDAGPRSARSRPDQTFREWWRTRR